MAWLTVVCLSAAVVISACSDDPAPTGGTVKVTTVPCFAEDQTLCVDLVDANCQDLDWKAPQMPAAVSKAVTSSGADHVWLPTAITYTEKPPTSGPHRPSWAKWGEYSYLPPQRWLHNMEHGGITFLYHPCAGPEIREKLLKYAKNATPSAGDLLWTLTPYPDLPAAAAAVAWGHVMLAETVTHTDLDAFVESYHRKGPEALGMTGQYELNWVGE